MVECHAAEYGFQLILVKTDPAAMKPISSVSFLLVPLNLCLTNPYGTDQRAYYYHLNVRWKSIGIRKTRVLDTSYYVIIALFDLRIGEQIQHKCILLS